MQKAREDRPGGRKVTADEIGPTPEPFQRPLICEFCTSPVEPVRGYKAVPALFRLAKNAAHRPDCDLNPHEFIEKIARGSHGLAHAEDGILRLELPSDLASGPPHLLAPDDAQAPERPVGVRGATTRPYLPPAITNAVKIARFLQLHDFDPAVVARFRVQPSGHRPVPWGRFCYGPRPSSYADLYTRRRSGTPPTHPIAVHGTVQRITHDKKGHPYAVLATNIPSDNARFHIVLRSNFDTLITPLDAGTHLLAVGDWSLFDGGSTPHLRLFADSHWQIAYWTTDPVTGRPTEPTCPPPVSPRQRAAAQPQRGQRRTTPAQRAATITSTDRQDRRPGTASPKPAGRPTPNAPSTPSQDPNPNPEPARPERPLPAEPRVPPMPPAPPMPATAPAQSPEPPRPAPQKKTPPTRQRRGVRRWFRRRR